jgi:5-formyltetrahydrofolate cyclo-ligase
VTLLNSERAPLRKALRAARRGIPAAQSAAAGHAVARILANTHWLKPGRRVAVYASLPEELPTQPILQLLAERGCMAYLPRITSWRARRMRFEPVSPGAPRAAHFLDLILLPLVGFDSEGRRLGMGGGFYDRALAYRARRRHWRGPKFIGIAFELQRVQKLEPTAHDIDLDGVITERGLQLFEN